jgi:hypothetical protein
MTNPPLTRESIHPSLSKGAHKTSIAKIREKKTSSSDLTNEWVVFDQNEL